MEKLPSKEQENKENIVAASLNVNGNIYIGKNHAQAYENFRKDFPDTDIEDADIFLEGFITNKDRFVDRQEAAEIANAASQITDMPISPDLGPLQPWEEGHDLDSYDLKSAPDKPVEK